MIAWLTGRIAPATPDTSWQADTATIELGASPRQKDDMELRAREPPRIIRRPTTSLAPHNVGMEMSCTMLDVSVNHFFRVLQFFFGVFLRVVGCTTKMFNTRYAS